MKNKIIIQTLIFIIVIITIAGHVLGYSNMISLNYKNQYVTHILKDIRSQTNLEFVFDSDLLQGKKVSCYFKNVPIETVLDSLLSTIGIEYKILPTQLVVFYSQNSSQQILSGHVTDAATNQILPSANIFIKGTNQGTITDESGFFSIDHANTDICTLMVCYIGYNTTQLAMDSLDINNGINIQLKQKTIQLRPLTITDYKIPQSELVSKQGDQKLLTKELQFLPTSSNGDVYQSLQTRRRTF